jgi:hypothetical protein
LDQPLIQNEKPEPLFQSTMTMTTATPAPPVTPRKRTPTGPSNDPTPSIFIAGTATASVIISNLAPNVSVEDIKVALGNIGGGIKEVHIMSHTGQSLKAKVSFKDPARGNKECISKFNGVKADGMRFSFRTSLIFQDE